MPVATAVVLLALAASPAGAQTPAPDVARPDLAFSLGWLNVNKGTLESYDDWYNRSLQGAAIFGWHWSPHLKTEVEVSASTRARFNTSELLYVSGARLHVYSEHAFSTRRVTFAQLYQFGENAWFHPHVAAGLDLNWERIRRLDREVYIFDGPIRPNPLPPGTFDRPVKTELHARPFAAAGFKAYMTQRAFFRTDMRLVIDRRLEEVIFRFGMGVDF